MFHKVSEEPKYPEDITTNELQKVLLYLKQNGFVTINVSDLLEERVDKIVKKGLKPICITADDAHESIFFSRINNPKYKNDKSFIQTLTNIFKDARCTLFITPVGDDRVYDGAEGYFGDLMSLKQIIKKSNLLYKGVEFGYHTKTHKRMKDMSAAQTRELLQEQIEQFKQLGVLDMIEPILAYPDRKSVV